MSTVRKDIFTGARVIVAEQRGSRPASAARIVYGHLAPGDCPFCPGNEFLTPGGDENIEDGWRMRFFPNKYPALSSETDSHVLDSINCSLGYHEIFVDTRSHVEELKDFTAVRAASALSALRTRYCFYRAIPEIKHVQIFKNKGSSAGATQKHSHWQIIAGRFIPSAQETIARSLSRHARKTGECLYCSTLENEIKDGSRVIFENGLFAAIAPYASRFTYETWILPKRHFSVFSELHEEDTSELSEVLLYVLRALDNIKEGMDYNILLMDAPKTRSNNLFHWHIQILPRMGSLAGYEFSTGCFINHITPEKAAKALR